MHNNLKGIASAVLREAFHRAASDDSGSWRRLPSRATSLESLEHIVHSSSPSDRLSSLVTAA